jgi:hypothetical protein
MKIKADIDFLSPTKYQLFSFRKNTFSFIIFLSLLSGNNFGQLSENRKFELDSITSFIPKNQIQILDSVHSFINRHGINEEEKIWMFYGYIATYLKYDKERAKDFIAPDFSPQFTAQRKKGVCRDFARVFDYLCEKSKITSFSIGGKTKSGLFYKINCILHRMSLQTNHQWNIVRYNNKWHLMDATWSGIKEKQKGKIWNAKTKTFQQYYILRADRKFYDCEPKFMAKNHVPIHPAFFLIDSIPTFKTGLKKPNKQKYYSSNFNYNQSLDSLIKLQNPTFSGKFNDSVLKYSEVFILLYEYNYLISEGKWKTSSYFNPTLSYYDERIQHVKKVTELIKKNMRFDFNEKYLKYEKEMLAKREKLRIKLEKENKKKKKTK